MRAIAAIDDPRIEQVSVLPSDTFASRVCTMGCNRRGFGPEPLELGLSLPPSSRPAGGLLTIDTNPPLTFTRPSRDAASSQRLLPARQALRHEAEEFGVATPLEVGQRHGLKQSKSVENPQQVEVIGKASLGSGAGTHHLLRPP
jgi:hypothetical protein